VRLILDEHLFGAIDCSESCLHLTEFPATGTGDVVLSVWGVTLVKHVWSLSPSLLKDDQDTYISGFSRFTFHDVVGVSLSVALYDPAQGYREFLKHDHTIVKVERTWGKIGESGREFDFSCVCDWPYGSCDVTLWVNGLAELDIDPDQRITATQYCMAPRLYGCPVTPYPLTPGTGLGPDHPASGSPF
jgi:hypothetical protein